MLQNIAWVLLLLALSPSMAAPAKSSPSKPAPANKLDTAHIHRLYLDGDFDHAIELIEDALRYGGPFSHEDSVFVYKHLGVMHTAKYETREKGKSYMLALLNVEPTAKIMDMYASDMIYMIFKNIQDEFHSSRPIDPAAPERRSAGDGQAMKRSYAWVGWTVGALAVVGGVALAVHTLEEAPAPLKKENASGD